LFQAFHYFNFLSWSYAMGKEGKCVAYL
jgi:hypothetical protein